MSKNSVEINEDQPNYLAKAIYLELAIAKKLAIITHILADTQTQAEEWKSFIVEKKERLHICLERRLLAQGSHTLSNYKWDILCDWLRVHI